ncbi:MAG: M14 family zinc carboxypeptidase [Flavobacteriaceae bacterium]|nr:M14 family zinc carboxypeptidase [Flavobacteriaceae bacterium]
MKRLCLFLVSASALQIQAQIQSPEDFLGYPIGSAFSFHHQIIDYFKYLDLQSPQVQFKQYGTSYEGRPLYLGVISSQENLENLESLRENHIEGTKSPTIENKVIIWFSYGVHGNESSTSEVALTMAYDLITTKSHWLDDAIIIIDPCLNPDGRDRYVHFYKQSKSLPPSTNPTLREHREPWHSGRTNHYLFDLNRDWAWLTQIESQQRVKEFQKWLPHIHVDYHEQSIHSPYYFAPAAQPYHDQITDFQRDFQKIMGLNNANVFDQHGWLYFTKQVFDLLYPGYGDTYPLYSGSIGMTYEQAGGGRAGLRVQTENGDLLTLKDRIEHHSISGLTTIESAVSYKQDLIDEFQNYYQSQNPKFKYYILDGPKSTLKSLAKLLTKHDIKHGRSKKQKNFRGFDYQLQKTYNTPFEPGALIVSASQPKGKLVQVLFEPKTVLSDSLTYDITSWSLPFAYGLNAIASNDDIDYQAHVENETFSKQTIEGHYGIGIPYQSFEDSKFIAALLNESLVLRYAKKAFTNSGYDWPEGSFFLLDADNRKAPHWKELVLKLSAHHQKEIVNIRSGYSDIGIDLGSNDLHILKKTPIALLHDHSASPYRYGEIWHFFEQQLNYPLSQLPSHQLGNGLDDYDVLIIPDGSSNLSETNSREQIINWVRNGGKLIVMGSALEDIVELDEFKIELKEDIEIDYSTITESERPSIEISYSLTGSIFKTTLDRSHWLTYGIDRYYSLRTTNKRYSLLKSGGNAIKIKSPNSHVNGFAGSQVKKLQTDLLLFGTQKLGRGQVVYLVDNPLFRGFWYQGKQLFANALFFD